MLSIVVPCFREEASLPHLHQALSEQVEPLDLEVEMLFVDDGSPDGTLDVLRELAGRDSRVRYLSLSRNFGKESALLAGLEHAAGDAVLIMDADLQHPPTLLPLMLARMTEGFDQVVARRTRQGDPFRRTFLARTYYRLINRLIDVRLMDGAGDFRLLSRRAVDALLAMPERNRFSKGLFSWIGFPTVMVEYENVVRTAGSSSWTFRRLVNYGLDGVLSFNDRPLRLLVHLGGAVTLLSLTYIVWLLARAALYGIDQPGYLTLVSAVLMLGGLQLLALGILGEYIGRIYYEAKARPAYLLREGNVAPPHAGELPFPPHRADRQSGRAS
nr:glycosyltransferase family 2 protein [Motilibacter aurantiacus]